LTPAATGSVVPAAAVTMTTRVPVAAPDATATVTVSCVPPAFTVRFVTLIVVSTAPLELLNLTADAPVRLAPLIVIVTVAPLAMLVGEMLDIAGPVIAATNGLKTVAIRGP